MDLLNYFYNVLPMELKCHKILILNFIFIFVL